MLENLICRVCNKIYDGSQHFGVQVCRSCAAFFRRCVQKAPEGGECSSKGGCPVIGSQKAICRMCRYQRCVAIGMQRDMSVYQRKSATDGPQNYSKTFSQHSTTAHDPVRVESREEEINTLIRPIPTSFSTVEILTDETAPLLRKIVLEWRQFDSDRVVLENAVPGLGPPHLGLSSKVFSLVTLTRLEEIMKIGSGMAESFVLRVFPEVGAFDSKLKTELFAAFVPMLWGIEECYWTYRYLSLGGKKFVTSPSTYIDLDHPEELFENTPDKERMARQNKIRSMTTKIVEQWMTTTLPAMHALMINEVEIAVLIALAFWSILEHNKSAITQKIAEEHRGNVMRELDNVYRERLHMKNCASRFGDLMLVFSDVQMNVDYIRENFHMQRIGNAFAGSANFLADFIKPGK